MCAESRRQCSKTEIFNCSCLYYFGQKTSHTALINDAYSLTLLIMNSNADAHFTMNVPGTDPDQRLVYLCVADGVGSWRQYGVDPRNFSHR
jgi:hypothetical protein